MTQAQLQTAGMATLRQLDAPLTTRTTQHTHCVVNINCVEGNVDGKGGGVMMGAEAGLALGVVLHNKVHN